LDRSPVQVSGDYRFGDDHDNISGLETDDTIRAGNGNDRVSGKDGADALYGENGNDILDGGTGSDHLEGGAGNDIYVFRIGSGQDVINNYDSYYYAVDAVQFENVASNGLTGLYREGNDFIIAYGASDRLTILNHYLGVYYQIERFVFADEITLSASELYVPEPPVLSEEEAAGTPEEADPSPVENKADEDAPEDTKAADTDPLPEDEALESGSETGPENAQESEPLDSFPETPESVQAETAQEESASPEDVSDATSNANALPVDVVDNHPENADERDDLPESTEAFDSPPEDKDILPETVGSLLEDPEESIIIPVTDDVLSYAGTAQGFWDEPGAVESLDLLTAGISDDFSGILNFDDLSAPAETAEFPAASVLGFPEDDLTGVFGL
jgi:hypothetical protein